MTPPRAAPRAAASRHVLALLLAWTFVGVPLAWGVAQTVARSLALFR